MTVLQSSNNLTSQKHILVDIIVREVVKLQPGTEKLKSRVNVATRGERRQVARIL